MIVHSCVIDVTLHLCDKRNSNAGLEISIFHDNKMYVSF